MSLARDLADLAGEANGISNSVTANSSAITALSIAGESVSPVQSFRNKIINGNFDIWQRGTSVTGVTSGQYVADRWISLRAGTTANVSQQSFTLGQTDVPNEPTHFYRSVVTSVAGVGNYYISAHRIESVRTFAGQTATLSFWAKADASKNIAVEFVQTFGTGGSPSAAVSGIGVTTCALTTSWQKFTITVSIPSISGKTLGSDNNDILTIAFWLDAGSDYNSRTNSLGQQSGTFDIAQVQLEAVSVATPFEQRPIGTELALCQRYYQKSYNISTVPASLVYEGASTTVAVASGASAYTQFDIKFPVVMRSNPSVTTYNPAVSGGEAQNTDTGTSCTGTSADTLAQTGLRIATIPPAGTSIGNRIAIHWVASAEL